MKINDTLQFQNVGLPEDILRMKHHGDYENAIRYHQKDVELDPTNINSYWYLSLTQLLVDGDEAVTTMKKGMALTDETSNFLLKYNDILISIQKETKNPYKGYLQLITEEYIYDESDVKSLIESAINTYPDIYSNERSQMESILAELK